MKINKSHYSKYCDIYILYIIELDSNTVNNRKRERTIGIMYTIYYTS